MPPLTRLLTSDVLRDTRRSLHALTGGDRRARFYFRIDDPHSWLLAQMLPEFCRHFSLRVQPRVMLGLPDGLYPEPTLYAEWALRDAPVCAALHGLEFPESAVLPDRDLVRTASHLLLARERDPEFLALASEVARHVWNGNASAVDELSAERPVVSAEAADALLEHRRSTFLREGHYLTGTLRMGGEWYWGPDRLDHLALRLASRDGHRDGAGRFGEWRSLQLGSTPHAHGETLEFFFSFRSPYSYIAIERILRLAEHYGLRLQIRPVLPMVMRGLPVPALKRRYIVLDTRREAARAGVPFGKICDPVGTGVDRCMAIWPLAERHGKLEAFVLNAATAIWSEGIDVAGDRGLRRVVERTGLDWSEALAAIADESWRTRAEANRAEMVAAGNWGVPGFRFRGAMYWGQDRIPALERHVLAAPTA